MTKKTIRQFYKTLEANPYLEMSGAHWRQALGQDFQSLEGIFLKKVDRLACSVPCPAKNPCACEHEIIEHATEDIVAVCRCENPRCPTVSMNRQDASQYAFDFNAFAKAVCGALELKNEIKPVPDLHATCRVGVFQPQISTQIPVYMTVQHDASGYNQLANSLVLICKNPFILLIPTDHFWSIDLDTLLKEHNARAFALDAFMILNGNRLEATTSFQKLLADLMAKIAPHESLFAMHKKASLWRVVCNGKEGFVAALTGMDYIAAALAAPDTDIACTELVGNMRIPNPDDDNGNSDIDTEHKKGPSIDQLASSGSVASYKKRIAEIEIERELNEKDPDAIEKLAQEQKKLQQELNRIQGLHGKLRVKDNTETARQSVKKAYDRALLEIAKTHKEFARHLKATMKTGNALRYSKPDPSIIWDIKI